MFDGLRTVVKEEGFQGLMRGATGEIYSNAFVIFSLSIDIYYFHFVASIPRVATGSAVQLASYDSMKKILLSTPYFTDGVAAHLCASLMSGILVVVAMNPFDVVCTRIYNQPVTNSIVNGKTIVKPALYSGVFDCILKTLKGEGIFGFYKGFGAHYLRIGPHTVQIGTSKILNGFNDFKNIHYLFVDRS